jgi:chitinase
VTPTTRPRATATATTPVRATATATTAPRATPTSSGAAAWAPGVSYVVGVKVTYGGTTYTCRQNHTSQVGWEPPNVPALWTLG